MADLELDRSEDEAGSDSSITVVDHIKRDGKRNALGQFGAGNSAARGTIHRHAASASKRRDELDNFLNTGDVPEKPSPTVKAAAVLLDIAEKRDGPASVRAAEALLKLSVGTLEPADLVIELDQVTAAMAKVLK